MATHKPFRFGVEAGDSQSRAAWVAYARKVEDLGYSTLIIGEHPSWGGITPAVGLMAAADATTTLRLGSHVFANDFHHPVLLAQAAASLDLLSEGRLEFGIGSGWLGADYAAVGVPFDPPAVRIRRLAAAVALIKRLFGTEGVTFTGSFYQVTDLTLHPKPKQQPHPPILVGGGGRQVLTLAAREADIVGLIPKSLATGGLDLATTNATVVEQQVGWVRAAAGARLPSLELHLLVQAVKVLDNRRQAAEAVAAILADWGPVVANIPDPARILASPMFVVGSVDQIVADLQERRERYGISYITVFSDYLDEFSPVVARLAGT
jgi:probable F420-dependent oxidoreductase